MCQVTWHILVIAAWVEDIWSCWAWTLANTPICCCLFCSWIFSCFWASISAAMETCVLPELANCWRRVRDWRGPWVPVAEFPDSPVAPVGTLGFTTSWRLLTLALSSVDPATSVAFCRAGRGIVGTASMEPTTKMVPTITAISISYKIEGDIIHSIKRSLDNPSHESSYLIIKMELSCGLSTGNRCISEQIWRAVATWLTSSLHCAAYVCSQ